MQKKPFRSLRTKLNILLLSLIISTISFISIRNTLVFTEILEDQLSYKIEKTAEMSINSITEQINIWINQIKTIFSSFLSQNKENLDSFTKEILNNNKSFISITIFDKNTEQQFHAFTSFQEDKNFDNKIPEEIEFIIQDTSTKWLKKNQNNIDNSEKNKVTFVDLSQATSLPILTILIPFSAEDKAIFYASLAIWQETLLNFMPTDQETHSAVINPKNLWISAQKKHNLDSNIKKNLLNFSLSNPSSSGVIKIENQDSKPTLGAYAHSKKYDISSVFIRQPTQAYQLINKEIAKTILITMLIVLITIYISYYLSGNITNNLRKLTKITQIISAGNFSQKVSINTKDEVEILGNSINIMSTRIKNQMAKEAEAIRQEQELLTAQAVQNNFFPYNIIKRDNFYLYGKHQASSECGGDWWGHFSFSNDKEFICIGDATGHGASAALITAMVFSFIQNLANETYENKNILLEPNIILKRLNTLLWNTGKGKISMTFFIGIIDKTNMSISYANAGHNIPIVIPKNSSDKRIGKRKTNSIHRNYFSLISSGTPLGYYGNNYYENYQQQLKSFDRILLYTDGLTECQNTKKEIFGKKTLLKLINANINENAENLAKEIINSVSQFIDRKIFKDDITIVMLEMKTNEVA